MKHTRPTCVRSVSTNTPADKRRKTAVKCAVEVGGGKEGVPQKDLENDGKRTILCVECENIFSKEEAEYKGFESWLKKKSRQDYKVSGSRNRQPENTWSK